MLLLYSELKNICFHNLLVHLYLFLTVGQLNVCSCPTSKVARVCNFVAVVSFCSYWFSACSMTLHDYAILCFVYDVSLMPKLPHATVCTV